MRRAVSSTSHPSASGGAPRPVETLGGIVAKETRCSGLIQSLSRTWSCPVCQLETPCVGDGLRSTPGFIRFPTSDGSALRGRAPGIGDRRHDGATGACDIVLAGVETCRTSNITRPTCAGETFVDDPVLRSARPGARTISARASLGASGISRPPRTCQGLQITREDADAFAPESSRAAAAGRRSVCRRGRSRARAATQGRSIPVARDEGIRPESTPETLASSKRL